MLLQFVSIQIEYKFYLEIKTTKQDIILLEYKVNGIIRLLYDFNNLNQGGEQ